MLHKTQVILEKHEIDTLKRGGLIQLKIGGSDFELSFEGKWNHSRDGQLKMDQVLEVIINSPGIFPKEIADKLSVEPKQVYTHIYRLQKEKKQIKRGINGEWFPIIAQNGNGQKVLVKNGK